MEEVIRREKVQKLKNQSIGRIIYAYKEINKNHDSCTIGKNDRNEEE